MIKINPNYTTAKDKQQNFKGGFEIATETMKFLNDSPAIGASFVDFSSMAVPRTAVDSKRGLNAGIETGVRESSGTANDAAIGLYGLTGAAIMSGMVDSKYGIKSKNIHANTETIKFYSDIWKNIVTDSRINNVSDRDLRLKFIYTILNKTAGFNEQSSLAVNNMVKIDNKSREEILNVFKNIIDKNPNDYKVKKDDFKLLKAMLTTATGVEQSLKVTDGDKSIATTVESLINDSFTLSKAFSKENIKNLYKDSNPEKLDQFLKTLNNYRKGSTAIGLAIGCIIGASVQPLNRYFTKKRTGQSGFVGLKDDAKNKKSNPVVLNIGKAAAIVGMALLTYKSLGGKFTGNIKQNFKEVGRNLQFQGVMPKLNHFKIIYGLTLIGRFAAARDNNELRESSIKDYLGFINWLILGGFVAKLVAKGLNKDGSLLNIPDKAKNWVFNSTLKTHNEVLATEAQKVGVKLYENGKALKYTEVLKKVPNAKVKVRNLNIAQLAGMLYSGIVLGYGIPKLNIWLTNKLNSNPKTSERGKTIIQNTKPTLTTKKEENNQETNKKEDKYFEQFRNEMKLAS